MYNAQLKITFCTPCHSFVFFHIKLICCFIFPTWDYGRRLGDVFLKHESSMDSSSFHMQKHQQNFATYDCLGVITNFFFFSLRFQNFEEPSRGFGLAKNGKFNGMVGYLQREEADLCTILGATADRLLVVDYIRTYPSSLMTITSLKPPFLPQHSALIRPFQSKNFILLKLIQYQFGNIQPDQLCVVIITQKQVNYI